MAQKFVGIDLGTHHVKIVTVTSGLRGVQVNNVFEEPVEIGPEGDDSLEAASAVALAVLRERGLLRESVGIALPGRLVSYRLLEFPFDDARRIAQAVPFEADGQFPVLLEQMEYDHTEVVAPGPGGRALVVAIRKEPLATVTDAFEHAGAQVKLVTAGPVAMGQTIAPEIPPLDEQEQSDEPVMPVALVIDIGHRNTEFLAVGEDGPLACRSVRTGGRDVTMALARAYHIEPDAAEQAKQTDAFVPHHGYDEISSEQMEAGKIVAGSLEPLIRELEHTRLWLRASFGYEVTKLVLAGGGSLLNGLDAYLSEQTGLPVEAVEPKASGLRGTEHREWRRAMSALGTAMAAARRPLIQLHSATSVQGDSSWIQERMSGLVAIGVAIMAFGALDTIAQIKALEAKREAHAEELAAATNEVFGERMTNPSSVRARLEAVQGEDLMNQVPKRGALEVLAMITEKATPQDAPEDEPAPPTPMPGMPGMQAAQAGATGADEDDTGDEGSEEEEDEGDEELKPITDPSKGIFRDDELRFSRVDIRERKVELKASATRSSAQDRLVMQLQDSGCLTNISKGKVRNQNDRKVFEMSMDNLCYVEEPSEEEEDEE